MENFRLVLRKIDIKLKLSSEKFILYKVVLLNQKEESTKKFYKILEKIKYSRFKIDCLKNSPKEKLKTFL